MSPQALDWVSLRFPREVSTTQGLAALLALNGHSTPKRRETLVLEVTGTVDGLSCHLAVPQTRGRSLWSQLQSAIPGLHVEPLDGAPELPLDRAWRGWQTNHVRALMSDTPEIQAAAILTALSEVSTSETICLQWLLGPVRRPTAVASQVTGSHGPSIPAALVKAPFIAPSDLDADARRALRLKQGLPGWRAEVRIGVRASGMARQRQLLGGLSAAIRQAQGPSVELGFDGLRPAIMRGRQLPLFWRLRLNVAELLGLSGLPLGELPHLPVPRIRSRLLPPTRALSRTGYILGEASYPGRERPVAVTVEDSKRHIWASGATGSGKSTVALHVICQAMTAGRSVAVVEPKGDLIEDVLARVPADRRDDVVLIEPAGMGRVTGLNPLVQPGVPAELVADQVLAVFKGLFGEAIGPRTQDILTAGLLTLLAQPPDSGARSLVALPLLFTDAAFRRRLLANVHDPLGLAPFWAWWDGLSSGEQSAVMAAPSNKLRAFLVRPGLRRVVGQPMPQFDLRELFTRRRIVLFNLQKGKLGPESAGLLGSLAIAMLWQATLGRAAIPAERRHPTLLVVDEFQDYVHLAQDFADVLVQARGLGLSVFLSHQHLGQLHNRGLRSAVLSNARSRLVFATGYDEAVPLVKGDGRLTPEDVVNLGAYQAYAAVLSDNEPQPYVSLRTLPPPAPISDPGEVRRYAAGRTGIEGREIDRQLEALLSPHRTKAGSSTESAGFGVRRRGSSNGGAS